MDDGQDDTAGERDERPVAQAVDDERAPLRHLVHEAGELMSSMTAARMMISVILTGEMLLRGQRRS